MGRLALGLTAFVYRRHGTAAIALAASMKLFPGVLLLLLLARKRYKGLAISVVAFAVFTVAALRLLGPSIPEEAAEVRAGLATMSATHILASSRRRSATTTVCSRSSNSCCTSLTEWMLRP